jgi:hypothetical protein
MTVAKPPKKPKQPKKGSVFDKLTKVFLPKPKPKGK